MLSVAQPHSVDACGQYSLVPVHVYQLLIESLPLSLFKRPKQRRECKFCQLVASIGKLFVLVKYSLLVGLDCRSFCDCWRAFKVHLDCEPSRWVALASNCFTLRS